MIYITGDKHGNYKQVVKFCEQHHTTKDDVMIALGDNGINYYGHRDDRRLKKKLQALPITFILVRGNHDMRPDRDYYTPKYIGHKDYSGWFLVEEEFTSLLFTYDYGVYRFNDRSAFVIGGAYSVDKYHRLEMFDLGYHQYKWFFDEQLTAEERKEAHYYMQVNQPFDYIMSHTCPLGVIPMDVFLPGIDQSSVDRTMQIWLDDIAAQFTCDKWFCGHWHIDRIVGSTRFMFNDIIELDDR